MYIKELIVWVAPSVAGFITSVLLPFLIKKIVIKRLQNKINEVNSGAELKAIKEELKEIKNEVLMLRGKRK